MAANYWGLQFGTLEVVNALLFEHCCLVRIYNVFMFKAKIFFISHEEPKEEP